MNNYLEPVNKILERFLYISDAIMNSKPVTSSKRGTEPIRKQYLTISGQYRVIIGPPIRYPVRRIKNQDRWSDCKFLVFIGRDRQPPDLNRFYRLEIQKSVVKRTDRKVSVQK